MLGWIGWGDLQEHWIRALLHLVHREISDRIIGVLIMVGVTVVSGIAGGLLVWISVSLLGRRWRLRMFFLSCTVSSVLVGAFWSATFVMSADQAAFFVGLLLVFVFGFLCGTVIKAESEATAHTFSRMFRFATVFVLLAVVVGATTVGALSQPEKQFPKLGNGPIWNFDLAPTGCQRA